MKTCRCPICGYVHPQGSDCPSCKMFWLLRDWDTYERLGGISRPKGEVPFRTDNLGLLTPTKFHQSQRNYVRALDLIFGEGQVRSQEAWVE